MSHDQSIASDPAISAWVAASAGTGKTKVLTDRVLRLLLGGAKPEKILCITYTKAAAAEMAQRIDEVLGQWAVTTPGDLQPQLQALTGKTPTDNVLNRARTLFAEMLEAPQRIRIQTIHGFCQSVLKRFPIEAGIAPHFKLIDEATSKELLAEARTRMFTQSNGELDASLASAIAHVGSVISEPDFNDLIAELITTRQKYADVFARYDTNVLQAQLRHALGVAEGITLASLKAQIFTYNEQHRNTLTSAAKALLQSKSENDVAKGESLQQWLEGSLGPKDYASIYCTQKGEPTKSVCTNDAEKFLPGTRELLLSEQRRALDYLQIARALKIAESSMEVATIANALLRQYQELKRLHGALDYDDLIAATVQLFERSDMAAWVLYKLDGGLDHLLVDEAQDTNPAQWKIVDALTSEFFSGVSARTAHRTLFVVGDEKQSIYSFQGAEPNAFDHMQRKLAKRIEDSGKDFKRVRLALSYRSAEPVLQAVDSVFTQAAAREGLLFTESDISHEAHRKGMAGRVELWPLCETEPASEPEPWSTPHYRPSAHTLCAEQIAEAISNWLREKRPLPSQARSITAGDILILVQRRGAFIGQMIRALKKLGIPVAGADRLIVTEHIAVMDLMALGDFLLLPQDDLTLATILKSPLIGLSEEDLFTLAQGRGEQTLWERVKQNQTYAQTYDYLSGLLAKVDYLPPYELFSYILSTLGGRRQLAARLGHEIHDPLDEFLSLALQYERLHPPSLQGFLSWLRSSGTEIKRDMEQGKNEVRVMTVHGAKGLQAPIVFLPDTARVPKTPSGLLWTGHDPSLPLWSAGSDIAGTRYAQLKDAERMEAHQEYHRLLYVAMTRAEDELYITGWKSSKPVSEQSWYAMIHAAAQSWPKEGDKAVLQSLQSATPQQKRKTIIDENHAAFPENLLQTTLPERVEAAPINPSRLGIETRSLSPVTQKAGRARGLLMHRLLQYIPDVAAHERDSAIEHFLARYGASFTADEREQMDKEVVAIITHPDFAHVFSEHSLAEVPVTGQLETGKGERFSVSGQIDRLAVTDDEVLILDYKTNRDVPNSTADIPESYRLQMELYRELIKLIYPDKRVRCALLWTSGPVMMELEENSRNLIDHLRIRA